MKFGNSKLVNALRIKDIYSLIMMTMGNVGHGKFRRSSIRGSWWGIGLRHVLITGSLLAFTVGLLVAPYFKFTYVSTRSFVGGGEKEVLIFEVMPSSAAPSPLPYESENEVQTGSDDNWGSTGSPQGEVGKSNMRFQDDDPLEEPLGEPENSRIHRDQLVSGLERDGITSVPPSYPFLDKLENAIQHVRSSPEIGNAEVEHVDLKHKEKNINLNGATAPGAGVLRGKGGNKDKENSHERPQTKGLSAEIGPQLAPENDKDKHSPLTTNADSANGYSNATSIRSKDAANQDEISGTTRARIPDKQNLGKTPEKSAAQQTSKAEETVTQTETCNIYDGHWVPDPIGPVYTSENCALITAAQNCQRNGRPDKSYENWGWKPHGCEISRFNPLDFLELMRGKTIGFIGDSVARNHMESLLCALLQAAPAKNIGNKYMQRWWFRSHKFKVIRIWSAWLVRTSNAPFSFAPANLTKLFLDEADPAYYDYLPQLDVVVISSGHWWYRQSAFISKGEVVGGSGWWDNRHRKSMDNDGAFRTAMETAAQKIASHPTYKGITMFRVYSPDHYEGGAWDTGGSCTGQKEPLIDLDSYKNAHKWDMGRVHYQKEAVRKATNNGSRLLFMDAYDALSYRPDGHPGPFRSVNTTITWKNNRPPSQDCLHWCMPGPVDVLSVFLFETLKRELMQHS